MTTHHISTGAAGQFRDAHGQVRYELRLPTSQQRRSLTGIMRDYRAVLAGRKTKVE